MSNKFWLSLIVLTIVFAGLRVSFGQGPLTNAPNLMVRTDSNGSLFVHGVAVGAQGPLQNFGNIQLRTYGGGDLGVTFASGSPIICTDNGIATTSTDCLTVTNTTASTVGVPVQMSPRLKLSGSAWNSVGAASETDFWILENLPVTVAGTTTDTLKFGTSIAGGAVSYPLSLTSAGQLLVADGTAALPSLSFASETTLGLRRRATSILTLEGGIGSVGVFDIDTLTGSEHLNIKASGVFGFSSGNADVAAADTAISRISAGLLGVGTGTTGDFSASIKATTYVSAGSGMAVANVGANSCGTTAATIAGNNNAFVVTVGATSGSQCRVAFTVAAATEYDCTMTGDSATLTSPHVAVVDTTHTDFFGTFGAGSTFTGICFPR